VNKPKRKYRTIAWWQVTVIVVVIAVVGIVVVRFSSAASSNENLASSIQKEYLRLRAEQLAKQKPPVPTPKPTPPPTLPKPTSTPTKPSTPVTTSRPQSNQLLSALSTNISQQQKSTTSQSGSKTTATLNRNTLQSDPAATEEQESVLSGLPAADIPTLSNTVIFEPTVPGGTSSPLVAYYINRKLVYYSEKSPYTLNLDTVDLDNGTYVLNTVVFDAGEKQVARYDYKFNVQNNLSLWQRVQRTLTTPFRVIFQ
jgi:hypothetical protein